MEYRKLGGVGAVGSGAEFRHCHLRRRRRLLQCLGLDPGRGSHAPRRRVPRGRREFFRYGQHLLGRAWPRRCSAPRSRAAARSCSSPPRRRFRWAGGHAPNQFGTSRQALIRACEESLRRLGTDHIDVYYMHGFDATTPVEETLSALDGLIRAGKVRYIGCSNFSGWHLMKSLSISERNGWARHVAHQAYYSLASREFEWELMPLALDQKVGTVVWSALAGGALSGKISRSKPAPPDSRLTHGGLARAVPLGKAIRHHRRAGGDRFGDRTYSVAGGAELGAAAPERREHRHRRAQRRAAAREPGRGGLESECGADEAPRRRERDAARSIRTGTSAGSR